MHSRKSYFKDFSASMKMITELIELYLVKLQFIVVIKIVHFVFFYQYSISFIYSVYCISLSITVSFLFMYIYIYIFFFLFFLNTFFSFYLSIFFPFFAIFQYFIDCLIIHCWAYQGAYLLYLSYISCIYIVLLFVIFTVIIIIIIIINNILFAILISYCFYFLVYSFGN